ncbi:antirestriction protein ArdA [Parvularcula marina]|uniref:antirestriction protein ArdA n=1 Tax=Parvularcula marina TaxID=2292771 RepID=UPI0035170247
MIRQYYAQPYDISAVGFYFVDFAEYESGVVKCRNEAGDPVEEYEIQFIDGESIDAMLFEALSISQATIGPFIAALDDWDDHQKTILIIAIGECGHHFDILKDDPDNFEIDLYEVESLRVLAEQLVDEGLFGEVPKAFQYYIDYDAIARDLGCDYSMIDIAGQRFAYRCG